MTAYEWDTWENKKREEISAMSNDVLWVMFLTKWGLELVEEETPEEFCWADLIYTEFRDRLMNAGFLTRELKGNRP